MLIDDRILSMFYGWKLSHQLEDEFAAFYGMKYAVAVSSGTAALHCAYSAIGIGAGDEVIVPANSFITAATAALQLNAIPVFADINPTTVVLDPHDIERHITPRTKAVVAVHLYGNPVDMEAVCEVARRHNLLVVEDCAQAHGATIKGRKVGTFGDVAVYSLCCRKHMNAGEGGMVMTNNAEWAQAVRRFANKGKGTAWWDYRHIGYSYTMTELQAVFGLATLRRLPEAIARRRQLADIYWNRLGRTDLELLKEPEGYTFIYFKFPFKLPRSLESAVPWFEAAVSAENVVVERSYPCLYQVPWIRRKEYSAWQLTENGRDIVYRDGDCPVAEDTCGRLLAACTGPGIDEPEIHQTVDAILKVYDFVKARWPDLPPLPGQ
ncbi:MAG: DegT/DnrJ/EryC1/StrS family aminotransferase [Acetobacteraceae bacterium]|nr:DegT/DnrJ/EryC1/StrS family aminotransferase [Acetobacteraceae bacterium]